MCTPAQTSLLHTGSQLQVPTSPLQLDTERSPLTWFKSNAGSSPKRLPRKSFHHSNSISILPGAPADDYGSILDDPPSLIPDLLSIRTPVSSKICPKSNSFSIPPLHCPPPHFIPRKSQSHHSCLQSSLSGFFFLKSPPIPLQPHWPAGCPPSTPGTSHLRTWHWLFPRPSGLCSNVTCSVRLSWLCSPCVLRGLNQTMPPKCTSQGLAPGMLIQ